MPVTAMKCECGGTFFYTVRAEQFQAGGFGTAEFRSISNAPKTLLVCLCGKTVAPKPSHYSRGTVAGIAEKDFEASVEAVNKYRSSHSLDHVAQIAVSPNELNALQAQVTQLSKVIEDLQKAKPKPKAKESHVKPAAAQGSST